MQQSILINIPPEELKAFIKESIDSAFSNNNTPKEISENSDLLKIEEVCKILNISKVTVHAWKKKGLLPFYRISNMIYFKKNEILDALKKITNNRGNR